MLGDCAHASCQTWKLLRAYAILGISRATGFQIESVDLESEKRLLAKPPASRWSRQGRDGGTGRRSGLKIRRGQPRGGSTPPPGTINTITCIIVGSKPGADFAHSLSKLPNQTERTAAQHIVRPFSFPRKIISYVLAPIGSKRA